MLFFEYISIKNNILQSKILKVPHIGTLIAIDETDLGAYNMAVTEVTNSQ